MMMTPSLNPLASTMPAPPAAARAGDNASSAEGEDQAFARELNRALDGEAPPSGASRPTKPATTTPARGSKAASSDSKPANEAAARPAGSDTSIEPKTDESLGTALTDDAGEPHASDLSAMIQGLLGLQAAPVSPGAPGAAATPIEADAALGTQAVALPAPDSGLPAMAATDAEALAVPRTSVTERAAPGAGKTAPSSGDVADLKATAGELPTSTQAASAAPATLRAEPLEALPRSAAEALSALPAALSPSATSGMSSPAAPAAATNASPPFEARLAAALGTSEFAPAFGQQVRVMVQDGVQHARLHLNPAEMGPITIQIALDGSAAQVHLAAEQPLTRQALEQAMPVLASSLREGGLTLSGGGVFEQPRDPQREGAGRSDASGSLRGEPDDDRADAGLTISAPAPRQLRGAVDLIA